jgi:hypothetical protein
MQPYAYGPYPNGGTMPVRNMVPTNYQPYSPSYANQSYNNYNGVSPNARSEAQLLRYPPPHVPLGYVPGYMAPGLPPPPMSAMMPIMTSPQSQQQQHPQGYYHNPDGSYGVHSAVPKNGAKGSENKGIQGAVGGREVKDLLKQKGTKLKVSKIYRITKHKPINQNNDSTDDEYEKVSLDTPQSQPLTQRQPQFYSVQSSVQIGPPPQSARILSAASSCSHCSTCSNCSCSECRTRNGGHMYDDCPECRAEQERAQSRRNKHK